MNLIGKVVVYKNTHYTVLEVLKVKHPEKGEWFLGYRYARVADGEMYVRETVDFEAKFKEVTLGSA